MHQQEKYQQHPIFSVDAPGTVIVTTRPQQQPTNQKVSLVFGGGLLLLIGATTGLIAGNHLAERRVVETQNALKLEQLQRAATTKQIQEFCTERLGGNYGR